MNREEALEILAGWVKSPSLLRHCLGVEHVMRLAAHKYGGPAEDPEKWALAGLLHDADWEQSPGEHPARIVALLRERGEAEVAHAISAHGAFWGVPHVSAMDRTLVACDELTGLVVACALLRPDGVLSLGAESVLKKMKDAKFAAGVDRNEIAAGARILGAPLPDHVSFVIAALRDKAGELGLGPR